MTPWVTRLLLANALIFVLSMFAPAMKYELSFVPLLVLSKPWTIITYMFLHGDFWHLLFNMIGLYFFGPRLEHKLGSVQFLTLYFFSGMFGAAVSFLNPLVPIIGASGAVFGVMLGFARYWPHEQIYLWAILPIKARWFVIMLTLFSLFGTFGFTRDNIAHLAHLGGFLGGWIYLRVVDRKERMMQEGPPAPRIRQSDLGRWKAIAREKLHEVNRAEFDRIMEKIDRSGPDSLNEGEIAFMERFSSA